MDKNDGATAPTENSVPVDKLVRVYLKMRTARDKLVKEHETELAKIEGGMTQIKQALLAYCKTNNVESSKTADGMFYRTIKKRYWTSDWDAMGKFILEHQVPELLEKRLHQANTQTFLEQHPDLLPPGLNVDSEYTVTIRSA
jgi:hypothetical protein